VEELRLKKAPKHDDKPVYECDGGKHCINVPNPIQNARKMKNLDNGIGPIPSIGDLDKQYDCKPH
jgi:hypothetical protein